MYIANNSLLFITVITGILFVTVALIVLKFPPKKINCFYGYRTKSSMKTQERWDFAQKYASKKFLVYGLLLIIIGFLSTFITLEKPINSYITISLIFLSFFVLFYMIESELKKDLNKL